MTGFVQNSAHYPGSSRLRISALIGALMILVTCAFAAPLGATTVKEAMPGASYTKYSPALALQAWQIAATVAHLQEPRTCKTAKLVDTKVVAVQEQVVFTARGKLQKGRWSEIWTFDKCGRTVRVRADFKADGKGTADGEFKPIK